jgi:hypothetical protein
MMTVRLSHRIGESIKREHVNGTIDGVSIQVENKRVTATYYVKVETVRIFEDVELDETGNNGANTYIGILKMLAKVQYNLDCEKFFEIFGEVGAHLWHRYDSNGRNLIDFFTYLDGDNKEKFSLYLQNQ